MRMRILLLLVAALVFCRSDVSASAPKPLPSTTMDAADFLLFSYDRKLSTDKEGIPANAVAEPAWFGFRGDDLADNRAGLRQISRQTLSDFETLFLAQVFSQTDLPQQPGDTVRLDQGWPSYWQEPDLRSLRFLGNLAWKEGDTDEVVFEGSLHLERMIMAQGVTRDMSFAWTARMDRDTGRVASLNFLLRSKRLSTNEPAPAAFSVRPASLPDPWLREFIFVEGGGTCRMLQPNQPAPENMIHGSIRRGAEFLKQELDKDVFHSQFVVPGSSSSIAGDGNTLGPMLLALYALLKTGEVAADDAAVLRALDTLQQTTYPDVEARADINTLAADYDCYTPALVLLAGQHWLRLAADLGDESKAGVEHRVEPVRDSMARALRRLLDTRERRRKQKQPGWGMPDLSNTQYAVLGLDAAQQAGLLASDDKETIALWNDMLDLLLAVQSRPEGRTDVYHLYEETSKKTKTVRRGWGYSLAEGQTANRSMTATGIACVQIAMTRLDAAGALKRSRRADAQDAVLAGIGWLQEELNWRSLRGEAGYEPWLLYSLFALERAGSLTGGRYFGDCDWYRDGALVLCPLQGADGAWSRSLIDTAFALLFLRRASAPLSGTGK